MPRRLSNSEDRRALAERLQHLTATTPRRWGTLDVGAMLAHLTDALRIALGELAEPGTSRRTPLRFAPVRWLVLRLPAPLPRNAPSHPAFFATPAAGFERDRAALMEAMERFVAAPPDRLCRQHPLFGTMRKADWDLLAWRHIDHHLRQFGV